MKPNIIFIIIDSLRADKCHAEHKTTVTPNLDNLIQKGIYFDQAISSSDYTISGYGCIFTGLYPINAGKKGMTYYKLFSKVPNYISHLKNYGYHTYATMDSNFLKLGFSEYFENDDSGYDRVSTGLFEGLEEQILKKIHSKIFKEPWFYFIHLDDLHIPIRLPKKYMNKKYSERYDFVVEKVDSFLGKILNEVDLENMLIVFTADHGDYILSVDDSKKESITSKIKSKIRNHIPRKTYDKLAERKRITERSIRFSKTKSSLEKRTIDTRTAQNRFLFDDLVHIPLLFLGFSIPKIGVVTNLVRNVDIFPTITDVIGIPNVQKNINGRSLLPIIKGQKIDEEPVYLENTIFETATKSPKPGIGIRTSHFKYFRSLDDPTEKIHLYDLQNDPLEENNIADTNPEIINDLEKTLSEIRNKLIKDFEEPELTEDETKKVEEELKKLGYI